MLHILNQNLEITLNFLVCLENKNKKINQYHNFLWLSLIDRKVDGKNLQKIIYLWMLKFSNFKTKIWETSTLSSRVISWILNVDIIINNYNNIHIDETEINKVVDEYKE